MSILSSLPCITGGQAGSTFSQSESGHPEPGLYAPFPPGRCVKTWVQCFVWCAMYILRWHNRLTACLERLHPAELAVYGTRISLGPLVRLCCSPRVRQKVSCLWLKQKVRSSAVFKVRAAIQSGQGLSRYKYPAGPWTKSKPHSQHPIPL